MGWDMAVLRESPWYQEILREGERQCRQVGIAEGRLEESRSLIFKLLARRIGNLAPDTTMRVQALSLEQLEALAEALLDFTELADLVSWLDAQRAR